MTRLLGLALVNGQKGQQQGMEDYRVVIIDIRVLSQWWGIVKERGGKPPMRKQRHAVCPSDSRRRGGINAMQNQKTPANAQARHTSSSNPTQRPGLPLRDPRSAATSVATTRNAPGVLILESRCAPRCVIQTRTADSAVRDVEKCRDSRVGLPTGEPRRGGGRREAATEAD